MTTHIHTESDLDAAIVALTALDPRWAPVMARGGRPPLRRREGGFAGLAQIIVSQQVSVASAAAIHGRLVAIGDPFDHTAVLRARKDKLLRVGLTGGLASGKSTVARMLHGLGAAVLDADEIVRGLYREGGAGAEAARELFGDSVLGPDGLVDRTRIAALVFANPEARHALEARIHPLVRAERERFFAEAGRRGAPVAVVEASQLLEAKTESEYDRILLVMAPEEERVRRWEERQEYVKSVAECIIGKQRHGPIGTVPLKFTGEFTRFSDLDREYKVSEE